MLGLDPLCQRMKDYSLLLLIRLFPAVISLIQQEEYGKRSRHDRNSDNRSSGSGGVIEQRGGKRVVNYLTGEQLPRIC